MTTQKSEDFKRAFSYHQKGKLTDARDLYIEILKSEPENAEVWDLLGVLYCQVKDYIESEICIKKAIELQPRFYYVENLAKLYLEKGDFSKALSLYEDLVEHSPTYENCFHLAVAYKETHQWEKAKNFYLKSIEINPKGYKSYFNLAYLALNENNPEKAVECYQKALEIEPLDWESKYFQALAYMQLKDYKRGFEGFETRLCRQSAVYSQSKIYPQINQKPEWQGEDLTDKVLFTYYEAGFGDMIMLYRYIPQLVKMCKKLIIKPQKELAPLFEENSNGAEIIEKYDFKNELCFDYHIPFLSIPYVLGLEGEDVFVHHDDGYLKSTSEKFQYYKGNYCKSDKFKIGIKWQGNTHYDIERVLNVEDFFPLFKIPNTQFYSFQTFDGSEKIDKIKSEYNIVDLGSTFENFSDTAGAIENMDLIISNDTSLVHLAGAMKKQCWVLLPYIYNWRWHTDLSKCDWYDSVKIFRQKDHGDWQSVFVQVEEQLKQITNS